MNKFCPCGSSKSYNECCGLIISGKKEATTCVELMRSRYAAFTVANIDYLRQSHHSHSPLKATQKYSEVDGIGSLDGSRDFKRYCRRS